MCTSNQPFHVSKSLLGWGKSSFVAVHLYSSIIVASTTIDTNLSQYRHAFCVSQAKPFLVKTPSQVVITRCPLYSHCVFGVMQVIKAISGKGAPACNCVALTGMTGEAKMFRAPRKAKA